MTSPYQKAYFLLSVADINQLPPDQGYEVAIVGRSNAGKSSVINKMTHKGLARVSKTPGRTQMVNLFVIDAERRLADLPGYGFAKVPMAVKLKWQKTVDAYICERESLRGLVLVMDARHPFRDLDLQLLDYCEERLLPVHILLNKCDKLTKSENAQAVFTAKEELSSYNNQVSYQLFSAMKGIGVKELHILLNTWYQYKTP